MNKDALKAFTFLLTLMTVSTDTVKGRFLIYTLYCRAGAISLVQLFEANIFRVLPKTLPAHV